MSLLGPWKPQAEEVKSLEDYKEFWSLGVGGPEDSWAQLDSRTRGAALKSAPRRQLGNHRSRGGQFPEPGLATEGERR